MEAANNEASGPRQNRDSGVTSTVEIAPDLENLRSYSNAKLTLADVLRSVRQALISLGRENAEDQCRELMAKLAEDRFTLAVLGQFKRGKSSLMNAIIGQELLPTGVLPLTSAITVLRYGPTERLVVDRENSLFAKERPVSELADYVTEKGNPHNQKKVKAAYLEVPIPFLRYGIEFVDTPGVGSSIAANTETTYNFLPNCDAVLFVTSVDTPMTSLELEFLRKIKEHVNRIFFIVNKIDLVSENEKQEIVRFVEETIKMEMNVSEIKIFPVSSQLGLAARSSGEARQYEQSGLRSLQDELALFLTKEKSTAFLATIAYKGLRILQEEDSKNGFNEEFARGYAEKIRKEGKSSFQNDPYEAVSVLRIFQRKLKGWYDALTHDKRQLEDSKFQLGDSTEIKQQKPVIESVQVNSVHDSEKSDLKADLEVRGCPVCDTWLSRLLIFLRIGSINFQPMKWPGLNLPGNWDFVPFIPGSCLISSPQGASIGYAQLAEEIAGRLRKDTRLPEEGKVIKGWIHNSKDCRVCRFLAQVEQKYIRGLMIKISEDDGKNWYRRSQGVCLRHLGMIVEIGSVSEICGFVIAHAAQKFEEDAEDMRSYSLKNDALRRSLQNENEKDAYRRTIIRTVGERRVCSPWAEDAEI